MNKILLPLITAACLVFGAQHAHSENAAQLAKRIVDLTNQYRASKNLEPLQADAALASQALAHSMQMSQDAVPIGHDGFENRLEKIRPEIKFSNAGENVGYLKVRKGDIARRALDMWMKSPGHNKNLLGDFNLIGVGVATDNEGATYLTQIFVHTSGASAKSRSNESRSRLSPRSPVQVQQISTAAP